MVMDMELLLKIIALPLSLISLALSIIVYLRTKRSQAFERTSRLTDRLYELDKLTMQYPEVQKTLHETISNKTPYFTSETAHTSDYFRLKTFIYYHLNFYDEIFTIASTDKYLGKQMELDDWKIYICKKMRHPLFKEVFKKESSIFGERFRNFIRENEQKLEEAPVPEAY